MAKVLGVGGVFFKSPDPDRLYDWYVKHLGVVKKAIDFPTTRSRCGDDEK